MKVSKSRTVAASPDGIWRAIASVESIPGWMSNVNSAQHVGGPEAGAGRRQSIARLIYRRDVETEQEVVGWEPNRRMELLNVRDTSEGRELRGVADFRTTITLEPDGERTRVRATYSWAARPGLSWLLSLLFGGRTMGRELTDTLKKLDRHVAPKPE